MSATIPVSFPDEQAEEIRAASDQSGLSQQDIIRQASKLGLGPLLQQLSAKTGRVTNVDPLPAKVLDRLYREREDDEASIRRVMGAQPKGSE